MYRTVEGIVLKVQDYGESNKIVTIYSKELGKISAIAKGAKKASSRMNAPTQVFVKGEFLVFVGKGLSTIQQAQISDSFRQIGADIEKTAYAAYIVELTDKLLEEKQPDLYLYNQLTHTMDWINRDDKYQVPIFMYELKLFSKGGFSPVLNRCVRCASKQFPFAFSIEEGGLLCNDCRYIDEHAKSISDAFAKLLNAMHVTGLENVGNISIKPTNELMLRQLLDEYYDKYGGYFLKSKRFLGQLDALK